MWTTTGSRSCSVRWGLGILWPTCWMLCPDVRGWVDASVRVSTRRVVVVQPSLVPAQQPVFPAERVCDPTHLAYACPCPGFTMIERSRFLNIQQAFSIKDSYPLMFPCERKNNYTYTGCLECDHGGTLLKLVMTRHHTLVRDSHGITRAGLIMNVRVLAVMPNCMDASRLLGIQRHVQLCPHVQLISVFFLSPLVLFRNRTKSPGLPEGHEGVSDQRLLEVQACLDQRQAGPPGRGKPRTGKRTRTALYVCMSVFPCFWPCVCWGYSI